MKKLFFVLFSWLTVAAQAQVLPPHFPAPSASFTQKHLMPKGLSSLSKPSLPNAMRTMQPNTTMVRLDSSIAMDSTFWDSTYSSVHRTIDIYEYNSEGKVIKDSVFFKENNQPRALDAKTEYEYDANGRLVKAKSYWDESNGSLLQQSVTSFVYNTSNNLVSEAIEVMTNGDTAISNYTYDANNQLIVQLSEYKSSDTTNWTYSKAVYNFDAAGRRNKFEAFNGQNPAQLSIWLRDTLLYNANNKVDSVWTFRFQNGNPVPDSKSGHLYDGNGNNYLSQKNIYDTASNSWHFYKKNESQYNLNYLANNMLPYWPAIWWFNSWDIFYTNVPDQDNVYDFNNNTNTWALSKKTNYYYSPMEITSTKTASTSQASLYPNPATNVLNVQLSGNATEGQISLYDAQGRRVLNQTVSTQQSTLDLQALPQGMYFYRLQTDGQKLQTGKVTKL